MAAENQYDILDGRLKDARAVQISDAIVELFKAYGYDVEFLGGQLADGGKWQFCITENKNEEEN